LPNLNFLSLRNLQLNYHHLLHLPPLTPYPLPPFPQISGFTGDMSAKRLPKVWCIGGNATRDDSVTTYRVFRRNQETGEEVTILVTTSRRVYDSYVGLSREHVAYDSYHTPAKGVQ
jgi:hypothetical protein